MSRDKRIQLWLSVVEYKAIKKNAEKKELSMSEVLRDYLKTLPEYPKD